jgi:hypothetical protein
MNASAFSYGLGKLRTRHRKIAYATREDSARLGVPRSRSGLWPHRRADLFFATKFATTRSARTDDWSGAAPSCETCGRVRVRAQRYTCMPLSLAARARSLVRLARRCAVGDGACMLSTPSSVLPRPADRCLLSWRISNGAVEHSVPDPISLVASTTSHGYEFIESPPRSWRIWWSKISSEYHPPK